MNPFVLISIAPGHLIISTSPFHNISQCLLRPLGFTVDRACNSVPVLVVDIYTVMNLQKRIPLILVCLFLFIKGWHYVEAIPASASDNFY